MRAPGLSPLARGLPALDGAAAATGPGDLDATGAGPSFAETLGQALSGVDALQVAADQDARRVAMGAGSLHETALALEKADIALRVAVKVRNKLVEAYQDVLRMPV